MIYDETYNASMHQRFGIEINISELNITSLKARESPRVTFEHISQPEFTDQNL